MSSAGNFTGLILLTGLPGSGKSLRMVTYMKEALALGRPVYVCNMPTIRLPGVQILDNPHEWRTLPPESILFVDEAQRFFRARRGNVEPPESITAMETIRHDGVCIVMTTQQPTYLDKHIRGLIGKHEHFIRNFGHESANVYEFKECYDDVQSPTLRDNGQFSVWLYPKKNYQDYDSAEVHTVKARVPRKLIIGAAMFVAALAIGAYSMAGLFGMADSPQAEADPAPAGSAPQLSSGQAGKPPQYQTAEQLARFITPRVDELAWSAPAFDGRDVVAQPMVYCMSSEETSCTCLTEQGTRYRVTLTQCRHMARNGPGYNPYLEPLPVERGVGAYAPTESASAPVVGSDAVSAGSRGDRASGDIGPPENAMSAVWGRVTPTLRASSQ